MWLAELERDVLTPARETKLWQYIVTAVAVGSQQTQEQAMVEDNGTRLFCHKIQTVRAKGLPSRGLNRTNGIIPVLEERRGNRRRLDSYG